MALFYLLLLVFICTCNAQSSDIPIGHFCNDDAKINSSKVPANIGSLLIELASSINDQDGFSIASQGKDGEQVYGLAQCRGDLSSKADCLNCIQDASIEIRKRCPYQADARIWYDYCFLRYDTDKFYGQLDTSAVSIIHGLENVTDPNTFDKKLGILMDRIRSEAVIPGKKFFATGKTKLSPFITLYALVQCTRDLSRVSCAHCLAKAVANFPIYCPDKVGCQVLYSSCDVRFEMYPFFFPLDPQEKSFKGRMKDYSSIVLRPKSLNP